MGLESTLLTTEMIREILSRHYGLHADTVVPLQQGSANCFHITCGGDSYLLKEHLRKTDPAEVEREIKLNRHLLNAGIPTAEILTTKTGESQFSSEGRVIILERYLTGIVYRSHSFPGRLLPRAAALLAHIHTALDPFDLPSSMDQDWFSRYNPKRKSKDLLALAEDPHFSRNTPAMRRTRADLQFKSQAALTVGSLPEQFGNLTYRNSHGDYNCLQLISGQADELSVIDFTDAARLPVVWELMRFYAQSLHDCKNPAEMDLDRLTSFFRSYMLYLPLTEDDLRAAPYLYLYQLARSNYGYRQYLSSDSPKRRAYLDFAHWRTEMLRFLMSDHERISSALLRLA